MGDPPAPSPAQLLAAAAELEERADYGAFRDRMQSASSKWTGFRAVASWLRQQAGTPQAAR